MSYNKETGMYEGYIYCITNNINGKQYIGQTSTTIERRFISHKSRASHNSNQYIHNAMRSYGIENFTVKEIECISHDQLSKLYDELDRLEIHYISLYKTLNPHGYNNTIGGRKNDGFQIRKRKVFQFSLQGDLIEEYSNLKEASDITGFDKTGISKCCLLEINSSYGYVWRYQDTLQEYNGYVSDLIQDNDIKVSFSGQHIVKSIIQYDLDGNVIQQFKNINDIIIQCNGKYTKDGIYRCCRGVISIHQGYVWRYANDPFDKYSIKQRTLSKETIKTKSIVQYDALLNVVSEFENINCIDFLDEKQKKNVICCCEGKAIKSYGYIWRFKDDDIFKYKTQRARYRSVVMLTKDGQFVQKFSTAKEAADYVNGDRSCIIKCCKGIRLGTHKGYKWKYLEEFEV